MNNSNYNFEGRWGQITEVSNDKGPYKLARVQSEGHEMEVLIVEPTGVQANPLKDSQIYIFPTNADNGQVIGIALPPPAKRVDQQKEGEVTYSNLLTENAIKHDADGNTTITTPSGAVIKEWKDGRIGVKPAPGQKVFLGDVDNNSMARVATEAGLSVNVYAKV